MEPLLNEDQQKYQRAKKRVEEMRGFYGNLSAYLVMSVFFVILNVLTSPGHYWFYWPMLGWGLGVVFHGLKVFNYSPLLSKDWEERKMREFMEKEEENRKHFQS